MPFNLMRKGALHDDEWTSATCVVRIITQPKFFDRLQPSPVLRHYRLLLSGVACVLGRRVVTHCGGLLAALARSCCTCVSSLDLSQSDYVVHACTLVCVFSIARSIHACKYWQARDSDRSRS